MNGATGGAGKKRVTSRKRVLGLDGVAGDRLVVGVLGVGERDPGVDLQRLTGGVAGVGLDEGVVDPLGLEPGEQEVAKSVGADRALDAGGGGVARQDLANPPVAVGLSSRTTRTSGWRRRVAASRYVARGSL